MSRDNSRTRDPWEEPSRETSYEAHLRLKRLKQRAHQSKANQADKDTSQANARPRSQVQRPATPKDRNTSGPRQRPPQPRRHPLPSESPFEENNDTDVPSRSYRSRSHVPEMNAGDIYDQDMYDTDAPLAPAPPTPPRATTRDAPPFRESRPRARGEYADDYAASPRRGQRPRRARELEWEDVDRQAQQRPRSKTLSEQQARSRKRGFGSVVLIGCIGGLVTLGLIATILIVTFLRTPLGGNLLSGITSKAYTQKNSYPLQISNLKLAQIHNQVGNVNVTVSSSISTPTLTTVKKVTASSSSAANSEFARISVVEQIAGTTLTVNATIPGQGNSSSGDAVDLTLTLPPASAGTPNTSITFIIATISGNVNVQQVQLAASSCLRTNQGNVTFNGTLDTTHGTTLVPCQNTSTTNPHPWYTFHSEVGDVDVTLPGDTNVTLNASANAGSINGTAFGLNIPSSDNSASYHGPLINGSPSPPAELKLDVGTGNIRLHKG